MKKLPGIFNDVIGPVMRGPSSSHTAASWRIARIAVQVLKEPLQKALIEFDKDGAWAPNYREQGTTVGIDGGLLGLDITDERMKDTKAYANEKKVVVEYRVSSFSTNHANTVRLTLWSQSNDKVQIVAVSIGGGSFEIRSINGFDVQMKGDCYEIIFFTQKEPDISEQVKYNIPAGIEFLFQTKKDLNFYQLTSSLPFSSELIALLQENRRIENMALVNPVMPVISGRESEAPFTSLPSLVQYAAETDADLGELGLIYEKCISGMTEQDLSLKLEAIIKIIHNSVDVGLKGTH